MTSEHQKDESIDLPQVDQSTDPTILPQPSNDNNEDPFMDKCDRIFSENSKLRRSNKKDKTDPKDSKIISNQIINNIFDFGLVKTVNTENNPVSSKNDNTNDITNTNHKEDELDRDRKTEENLTQF